MFSIAHVYQSPSYSNVGVWSLTSSGLFLVLLLKSFDSFLILSTFVPFATTNFIWKSKAPPKIKAFARLVVSKRVNTNDML